MRVGLLYFIFGSVAACGSHAAGHATDVDAGSPDVVGEPDAARSVCSAEFANVTLTPMPPTVHLVVDASGSMRQDFRGMTRWRAVERGLVDATAGIVPRLSGEVVFGASVFNSNGGHAGGSCPTLATVPPAEDSAAALRQLIAATAPDGDTPTAEALRAAIGVLRPANPASRTVMLLATDGDPDNCNGPDEHNLFSQVLTENAVDEAYAAGIDTLVLSVGTDTTVAHLQRVANLGAGLSVHTGGARYFVANDADELASALEAMIEDVIATCVFRHGLVVTADQAMNGTVWLDGNELEYGSDWVWLDDAAIELLAGACDRATLGGAPVEGEFLCE